MNANTALAVALNQAGLTESADSLIRNKLADLQLTTDTGDAFADRKVSYILNGIIFVGEKLASDYVRAKAAVVSPSTGAPAVTKEQIETVKEKGRLFNSWRERTGMDIHAERVADFICGITGSVDPKEKDIIECAEANDISMAQAADVVRSRKLAMLSAAQRRNMHKHSAFMGWLADIDRLGTTTNDQAVTDGLSSALIRAYQNAGQYADQESRLIVESYAKQFDVILPKWADVLPKWTDASTKQLEKVQRMQNEVADARQQEAAQAERDISEQFGDF